MNVQIPSPRHYESMYGTSDVVRNYLNQIEGQIAQAFSQEAFDILRISLLIAHPDELAQGKFLEYEKFDWRGGFAAVGVNGNFERYHFGTDLEKILELSEMLQAAFTRISKRKKAKLDYRLASEIIIQTTQSLTEELTRKQVIP